MAKIVQKMEKHICKLSQRQLSLSEKATLSDTLILAKTAYLSNVFPIPDEIIYKDVLQKASQNHVIAGKIQWKDILPSLNFTKIWKNTYFSYRTPHTSDLLYRLLHHSLKTNQYTYKCSRDKTVITPNCDFYNKTEDLLHLFTKCNRKKNVWKHY